MTPLPTPAVLASLVTNVTETMLGIRFEPDGAAHPSQGLRWRTATLPIPGKRPITVGLSSDQTGCTALSAAMFSCPSHAVDSSMMDDSLRELLNMTAGLVKGALRLDQALGLPKIVELPQSELSASPPGSASVVLKANGLGLYLWVREGIQS